eukprot:gene58805-80535_t
MRSKPTTERKVAVQEWTCGRPELASSLAQETRTSSASNASDGDQSMSFKGFLFHARQPNLRAPTTGALAVSAAVLTLSSLPAQAADAKLNAAVASADRAADNKARDGVRRPAATLSFWGLKAKQTVIEISPG